ncbi:MAG: PAS domain S-box protein [Halanaerobium sp.]
MKNFKSTKIKIPEETLKRWQDIVDIIADLLEIPSALIIKTNPPYYEVFSASSTEDNPFKVGDRDNLTGNYCEKVILKKEKLLVSNALKDKNWNNNPDLDLGMISYLGFPIKWPNGDIFGTLCVLDSKENNFSIRIENLLKEYSGLIEIYLSLIYNNHELLEKQNRLEITLQSIGDGVITATPQGIITRMNNTAEKLTGWKQEKAVGKELKKVFNIVNTESKKPVKIPQEKVLITGTNVSLPNNTSLIAKDGTQRQIADSLAPIKDEEGNISGMILVFSDITERVKAVNELKNENKWLKALYENSNDPIVTVNKQNNIIDVNDAFEELFKYSFKKIEGSNLDQIMSSRKN